MQIGPLSSDRAGGFRKWSSSAHSVIYRLRPIVPAFLPRVIFSSLHSTSGLQVSSSFISSLSPQFHSPVSILIELYSRRINDWKDHSSSSRIKIYSGGQLEPSKILDPSVFFPRSSPRLLVTLHFSSRLAPLHRAKFSLRA